MSRMTTDEFKALAVRLFGLRPNNHDVAEWLSAYRATSAASVSLWLNGKRDPAAWIDVKIADLVEDRHRALVAQVESIEAWRAGLETGVLRRMRWADEDISKMRRARKAIEDLGRDPDEPGDPAPK